MNQMMIGYIPACNVSQPAPFGYLLGKEFAHHAYAHIDGVGTIVTS